MACNNERFVGEKKMIVEQRTCNNVGWRGRPHHEEIPSLHGLCRLCQRASKR